MTRYLITEAGGDAAKSAIKFLRAMGVVDSNIYLLDDNSKVLEAYCAAGYEFGYLEDTDHAVEVLQEDSEFVLVPTDEFFRSKIEDITIDVNHPVNVMLGTNIVTSRIHDKLLCMLHLDVTDHKHFKMPRVISTPIVIRSRKSAGSKSLQVFDLIDEIATEYIEADFELVVDYCVISDQVHIFPRITRLLKGGRDTIVTLLGSEHPYFEKIKLACAEITHTLQLRGVGNIQLLAKLSETEFAISELYFVEAACRLSGSSKVNLEVGVNLLDPTTYDKIEFYTHGEIL